MKVSQIQRILLCLACDPDEEAILTNFQLYDGNAFRRHKNEIRPAPKSVEGILKQNSLGTDLRMPI